ncbi:MAG: hypothetical protein HZC38_21360 [Chloroflexi bacterium]|nr:hypothetical protein [Chloroflexota bacterium]MBI5715954.1 hypothetical protein [Chloroflexota bacterium]
MKKNSEEFKLKLHPRAKESVTLDVPTDTLESLKKVAQSRDMSVEALIKFYVGQGLRQDISNLFADRVLETTEHILSQHIKSQEEVSKIIREIRVEAGH